MSSTLPRRGGSRTEGTAEQPATKLGPEITQTELGRGDRPARSAASEATQDTTQRPAPSDRPSRTRTAVRSPRAARQAIVLREVLGPPVSLRRGRSDVPGLSP